MQEAKGDEERESERDGEVGESHSTCAMRHGDDDETNKAQT